jgi:putative ABC transport system permease protein
LRLSKSLIRRSIPFYGELRHSSDAALHSVLNAETVIASADALQKLGVSVQSQVRLNGIGFRVAAVLIDEPDRLASDPNFYPPGDPLA